MTTPPTLPPPPSHGHKTKQTHMPCRFVKPVSTPPPVPTPSLANSNDAHTPRSLMMGETSGHSRIEGVPENLKKQKNGCGARKSKTRPQVRTKAHRVRCVCVCVRGFFLFPCPPGKKIFNIYASKTGAPKAAKNLPFPSPVPPVPLTAMWLSKTAPWVYYLPWGGLLADTRHMQAKWSSEWDQIHGNETKYTKSQKVWF